MSGAYDSAFYDNQRVGSASSAAIVVPMVLDIFPTRSVIDVGCGIGTWLRAFSENHVADCTGLDGDYVDRSALEIPPQWFVPTDLARGFSTLRRYDLACSLEVAEHLPAAVASGFIASLCAAAPVVLFSAAIPKQGGTEHVNERWQDFWRAEFARRGYRALDLIRPQIWGRAGVEWWYQQNIVLYADAQTLAARPELHPVDDAISLNVAHPVVYSWHAQAADMYLSKAVKMLPGLARKAVRRRLSG